MRNGDPQTETRRPTQQVLALFGPPCVWDESGMLLTGYYSVHEVLVATVRGLVIVLMIM